MDCGCDGGGVAPDLVVFGGVDDVVGRGFFVDFAEDCAHFGNGDELSGSGVNVGGGLRDFGCLHIYERVR